MFIVDTEMVQIHVSYPCGEFCDVYYKLAHTSILPVCLSQIHKHKIKLFNENLILKNGV